MRSTSSDCLRVDLNGPTMGTYWHAQFWMPIEADVDPVKQAIQLAVGQVDHQMSLWKPQSDICRLNRAAVDEWVSIPSDMMRVLRKAQEIKNLSGGAFDISVGSAVKAWGFGPEEPDLVKVQKLLGTKQIAGAELTLELDPENGRARKKTECEFDLNGIAKGFGTDRIIEVAAEFGITSLTAGIDGDLRCVGLRPDGTMWPIAIENPDYETRSVHSLIEITDSAIATSGDYRHWIDVGAQRLSHTIHPNFQAPLARSPASVTVLAQDCMTSDAWATALMVLGREAGTAVARQHGIQAMFLERAKVPA